MKTTIRSRAPGAGGSLVVPTAEDRRRPRTSATALRSFSDAFAVVAQRRIRSPPAPSRLLPSPAPFPRRLNTIAAFSSSSAADSNTALVNGATAAEEREEEEDEESKRGRSRIIDSSSTSTSSSSTSSSSPSPSSSSSSSPVSAADLASAAAPLNSAFLKRAAKRQWKKLATAGCCLLFCTACNLSSPVLAGRIFDSLISEASAAASSASAAAATGKAAAAAAAASASSSSAFLPSLLVLAFTYTAEPLVTRLYISSAVDAAEAVLASARVELFRCLMSKKIAFFDASPPLALARAAADDLDALRAVALASTARDRGPRAALEAAGAVVVLAWLSWRLGPVLALVIGATAAAAALHRLRTKPLEAAAAASAREMHAVAARALGAMPTVRSFGAERSELRRFSRAALASAEAARGFGRAKGQLEAMSRGAVHASLLLLYGLGGLLVRKNLLPAGVLLSAVGFTYSLVYATQGAVQSLADLRRAQAALARVRAAAAGEGLEHRATASAAESFASSSSPSSSSPSSPSVEGGDESETVDWRELASPDPSVLSTLPSSEECLSEAAAAAGVGGGGEGRGAAEAAAAEARRRRRSGGEATTSAAAAAAAAAPAASPSTTTLSSPLPLADIAFENVTFSYPTRPSVPVLKGLSLELKAGSVTALVGASGAGKSTVASLLARFYAPSSGSITHGGVDLQEIPFATWTRSVALVPQEIAFFDGTVAENIAFGFSGFSSPADDDGSPSPSSSSSSSFVSMDAVVAAAKAARAHDFISALPRGYETRVGGATPGGASLSGGQRQRVAIARALLKDAPVVVLDEHTSSLDGPAAAAASAEALRALLRGRTVLVIAHSLATVMAADRICVVENGRVVESGTHAELARVEGGAYARLVDAQALILG